MIINAAIPEKPQLQTPTLIGQNDSLRISIYLIQWEASNNSNSFDFDHYQIQYGDGSDFESTVMINETRIIISFESESVNNISVAVFSRCGQRSEYVAKSIPAHSTNIKVKSQGVNTTAVIAVTVLAVLVFTLAVALPLAIALAWTRVCCKLVHRIRDNGGQPHGLPMQNTSNWNQLAEM